MDDEELQPLHYSWKPSATKLAFTSPNASWKATTISREEFTQNPIFNDNTTSSRDGEKVYLHCWKTYGHWNEYTPAEVLKIPQEHTNSDEIQKKDMVDMQHYMWPMPQPQSQLITQKNINHAAASFNFDDKINLPCHSSSLREQHEEDDQYWELSEGDFNKKFSSRAPFPTSFGGKIQSSEEQSRNSITKTETPLRNPGSRSSSLCPEYEVSCQWSEAGKHREGSIDLTIRGLSCGIMECGTTLAKPQSRIEALPNLMFASSQRSFSQCHFEGDALSSRMELDAANGVNAIDSNSDSDSDSDAASCELNGELELEATSTLGRDHYSNLSDVFHDNGRLQRALSEGTELTICGPRHRNFSQKYRPKLFHELVGQRIVAHALSNAVAKGKIAPVYLFYGSRGTGKTSAARIFAAALNCLGFCDEKPCWICKACIDFSNEESLYVKEADAASNNGSEKVKVLLDSTVFDSPVCHCNVFIIDECHVLTAETWAALMKALEEPPINVVFILITTEPEQLPSIVISRCQKFSFLKIKDMDIVSKLKRLASLEQIEVDLEALELIACRADGSLRDAETVLEQLSLFGCKIDTTAVHDLVGSVSDEEMVDLLELALLGDTGSTIQKARKLIDSGLEPLTLMTQLATVITDILAGSHKSCEAVPDEKLERLRRALKILSEAEKQLRASCERMTWLIAALVQLGPDHTSVSSTPFGTSANFLWDMEAKRYNPQTFGHHMEECDQSCQQAFLGRSLEEIKNKGPFDKMTTMPSEQGKFCAESQMCMFGADFDRMNYQKGMCHRSNSDPNNSEINAPSVILKAGQVPSMILKNDNFSIHPRTNNETEEVGLRFVSLGRLDHLWVKVLESCSSLHLRNLLQAHCKLLSISISEAEAVVFLEFAYLHHKCRGEESKNIIASAFEAVLGLPVDVRISLASPLAKEKIASTNKQARNIQALDCKKSKNCMGSSHTEIKQITFPVNHVVQRDIFCECLLALPKTSHWITEEQSFEAATSAKGSSSYWNSGPESGSDSEKNWRDVANPGVIEKERPQQTRSHRAQNIHPSSDSTDFRDAHDILEAESLGTEALHQELHFQSLGDLANESTQSLLDTLIPDFENQSLEEGGSVREDPRGSCDSNTGVKLAKIGQDPIKGRGKSLMKVIDMKKHFKSLAKGGGKCSIHTAHDADPATNGLRRENYIAASHKKGKLVAAAESIAKFFVK